MTEDEAKAKWCPFSRDFTSVGDGAVGVNRWGGGGSRCIASACMAWRTRREDSYYSAHGGLEDRPRTIGFCGLVGAPQ